MVDQKNTNHQVTQFLIVFMSCILLSSCWIISGETPSKNNEITGNTLPDESNETKQNVKTNTNWTFGEIKYEGKAVENRVMTRREYFGDLNVNVSANYFVQG